MVKFLTSKIAICIHGHRLWVCLWCPLIWTACLFYHSMQLLITSMRNKTLSVSVQVLGPT